MRIRSLIFTLLMCCVCRQLVAERSQIRLDGTWQFQTDPERIGLQEGWHSDTKLLARQIEVPGSWQAQGVGEPRDYLRHDYVGQAWYKRRVSIPTEWREKQVWLRISGASRAVEVFVNGKKSGSHEGFSSPFRLDITPAVLFGEDNTIAIAVDNASGSASRLPLKEMDFSRPGGAFNFLGNWGGLYGHVALEATAKVWIDDLYLRTRLHPRQAVVQLSVASSSDFPSETLDLRITIRPMKRGSGSYLASGTVRVLPGSTRLQTVTISLGGSELWAPENPFLYVAETQLIKGKQALDSVSQTFGIREIAARNRRVYLNGQAYYLRGTGDLSVEVNSGTPSVSLEENLRRVKLIREYGFNFIRIHSRVPPEEFFQAADEMGLLVSAELPVFHSPWLLPYLEYLFKELPEVYRSFRNHPSWISSALGNELDPVPGKETEFQEAFSRFYQAAKRFHPDHLVTATDGFPFKPADYFATLAGYPLDPQIPVIAHEWGGWYCSLPNISLISRFTGAIDPYWMRETEEWLRRNGLLEIYPQLLKNSQRLQTMGHIFRVEKLRNNPDIQGYQIPSGIVDFPSGSREGELWEEGVFDFFWQPKYASAEEWSRVNAATLLVTDADISQRTWWQGKAAKLRVNASHYGLTSLAKATLRYRLEDQGKVLIEKSIPNLDVGQGELVSLADLEFKVPETGRAAAMTFRVELNGKERIAENGWTFWTYPQGRLANSDIPVISRIRDSRLVKLYPFVQLEGTAKPGSLVILDILDHNSFQEIRQGARALILAQPNRMGGQRLYDYFPTFDADAHAHGTRVESHPLFRNFPHDGFCDAQFYNLMEGAMALEGGRRPMVGSVAPLLWSLSSLGAHHPKYPGERPNLRKLGFIYEFRVGKGSVLVTSLNFQKFLDEGYPSVLYLFDQLLRYLTASEFQPKEQLPEHQFTQLLHWVRP